jgi:acyl carrier protein
MTVSETLPPDPELLGRIAGLLQEVTGEDGEWRALIGPDTRLDLDLLIDSVELASLSLALERIYGGSVNLAGYVAELEIDQIIALSVAEVAQYVAAHCDSDRQGAVSAGEVGGR